MKSTFEMLLYLLHIILVGCFTPFKSKETHHSNIFLKNYCCPKNDMDFCPFAPHFHNSVFCCLPYKLFKNLKVLNNVLHWFCLIHELSKMSLDEFPSVTTFILLSFSFYLRFEFKNVSNSTRGVARNRSRKRAVLGVCGRIAGDY